MTDFLPTIVDRGFHFLHVLLRLMYILRPLCAYLKKVKTKFANIKTETDFKQLIKSFPRGDFASAVCRSRIMKKVSGLTLRMKNLRTASFVIHRQ